MSVFISWVEHDGKNWFLTKNELFTERGKKLIIHCDSIVNIVGHKAIRWYYNFKGGFNKECSDFTNPNRFPPEIVQAIKDGLFEGMGIAPEILTKEAQEKYRKVEQQAWEECDRKERQAWEECNRKEQQAGGTYNKITQQAQEEYGKIVQQAQEEYRRIAQQMFWLLSKNPNNRIEVWK